MAILQIECRNCLEVNSLRGYVERADLLGTKYEKQAESITNDELRALEERGEIESPWDKWEKDRKCPNCGSKDIICV